MVALNGGDKLEAALAKIAKNLTKASSVEVGFLEGATYPDGTSVPLIAALNEFGVPSHNQPPRPFFRNAIADNSEKWPKNIATALKRNDYDAAIALDLVGAEIESEIRDSIETLTSPPLAPSTIAAKSRGGITKISGVLGPEKPLIDTGHMWNSVDHKVT